MKTIKIKRITAIIIININNGKLIKYQSNIYYKYWIFYGIVINKYYEEHISNNNEITDHKQHTNYS